MKTLSESFAEIIKIINDRMPGLGTYEVYESALFYAGAAAMAEQFAAGQSKSAELLAEIRDELHKLVQIQGEIADG